MKKFLTKFILRWFVSGLGLWIAAAILGGSRMSVGGSWKTVILAGLFLAAVNSVIKPILIVLSFPAIILSLGLFMLVINALMILLVSHFYSTLFVKDFWVALVAGIILGLVNYLVTRVMKEV